MTELALTAKDGGTFTGYLALPKAGHKAPGLVLIQEIFGVNEVMRRIADDFAAQGYLVLCPDLFWRQEPNVRITDKTDAEWQKAFALFNGFDVDKGVDDLAVALDALRMHPACNGKVGCVGYCLGGKLAVLMATRTSVNAAVSYYGVALDALLPEASRIEKPLMLHIAEEDRFVPKDAQARIKAGLAENPLVRVHSYPGEDHAFARVGGMSYKKDAAELANRRTAAFLERHLG